MTLTIGVTKLDEELGDFEQGRIKVVQKVDEKAFDVGSIVVLSTSMSIPYHSLA